MRNILIIKHGALGDVVLATGPFKSIREHHKDGRITLLTTPPYADMLRASGYFDEIWIDTRPKLHQIFTLYTLIRKINRGAFARVYDLQTSERTSWYFKCLRAPKPEWVGTAAGASHRHDTPERTRLHTIDRHKQQLDIAGIHRLYAPDVSWLTSDISRFHLPKEYAVIVPGGSAHRPGKRWPASHYAELCLWLVQQGVAPVLIGTKAEAAVLSTIASICEQAMLLQGVTSFADIAQIARGALCAVGNDTGPMHLIAATGTPSFVLFSHASDPALCAPQGNNVSLLRREPLGNLTPAEVIARIKTTMNTIAAHKAAAEI